MRVQAAFRFARALVAMNLKAAFALRSAFWLQAVFMLLNNVAFFVVWWIFFDRFDEVRGWRVGDVAALYGVVAAGFGLCIIFAGGVRDLAYHIEQGDLDAYLTQPVHPLLHAVCSKTFAAGWGDLASGIGFLLYAAALEPRDLALAPLAIAIAGSVYLSTSVIIHSAAFWLGRVDTLARQLAEFLITFSLYPRPLFTGLLKILLFTVLPAGFIGYLPVDLVREFHWTGLGAALAGALFYAAMALYVFAAGLRRYESGNRFGIRV